MTGPKEKTFRRPAPPTFFRVVFALLIGGGWALAWIVPWERVWTFHMCLFRRLTSLPCPFCELTHSCVFTARGRIAEALLINPLGPICMAASLATLAGLLVLLAKKSPPIDIDAVFVRYPIIKPAVPLLWGLNWAFMILRAI